MALPALPADTTSRYRLRYSSQGVAHVINCHVGTGTSSADALTAATALANLLKPILYSNTVFQGIDWAPSGSNVFNPIGTLSIAGTFATSTPPLYLRPYYVCFVGRSSDGRKVRMFVFGCPQFSDDNWRVLPTEQGIIGTVITGLNAGTGAVATISGGTPLWNNYANVGVHDHYVKRVRRTG